MKLKKLWMNLQSVKITKKFMLNQIMITESESRNARSGLAVVSIVNLVMCESPRRRKDSGSLPGREWQHVCDIT